MNYICLVIVLLELLSPKMSCAQTLILNNDTTITENIVADTLMVSGKIIFEGTWHINNCHLILSGPGSLTIVGAIQANPASALHIKSKNNVRDRFTISIFGSQEDSLILSTLNISGVKQRSILTNEIDSLSILNIINYQLISIDTLVLFRNSHKSLTDAISYDAKGTLSFQNTSKVSIKSGQMQYNSYDTRASCAMFLNVDTVDIRNIIATCNTATDTFELGPGRISTTSRGGSSIWIQYAALASIIDSYFSHDISSNVLLVEAEQIQMNNVHASDSRTLLVTYDYNSNKPHIFNHVSFTNGSSNPVVSGADDIYTNSIITGDGEGNPLRIQSYTTFNNRLVTYHNTAINYPCGDNCEGTIVLPWDAIITSSRPSMLLTTDDINTRGTPLQNSVLVDRVPVLASVPTDLLGRPRPQGTLADLGAFERPQISNSNEQFTKDEPWRIYPNPSRGAFAIEGPATSVSTVVKLTVYDQVGRLVWQSDVFSSASEPIEVSLSEAVPAGRYTAVVQQADGAIVSLSLVIIR